MQYSLEPAGPGPVDGLVARFTPQPDHRGPPGLLHGGIAATALDEVMASVGFALDKIHCMTATLELKYRRGVPLDGREVRVEAWRDRAEARRTHRVHGRIVLADGTVAVEATGIFVQVRTPTDDSDDIDDTDA
jgi:acyl-coenzyme A thioesterase PaaI-like protein